MVSLLLSFKPSALTYSFGCGHVRCLPNRSSDTWSGFWPDGQQRATTIRSTYSGTPTHKTHQRRGIVALPARAQPHPRPDCTVMARFQLGETCAIKQHGPCSWKIQGVQMRYLRPACEQIDVDPSWHIPCLAVKVKPAPQSLAIVLLCKGAREIRAHRRHCTGGWWVVGSRWHGR